MRFFHPFFIKILTLSILSKYQKNLFQSAQIMGIWSLVGEQNSHIRTIFYTITIMVEIYLRNSEAYGHKRNSISNNMFQS